MIHTKILKENISTLEMEMLLYAKIPLLMSAEPIIIEEDTLWVGLMYTPEKASCSIQDLITRDMLTSRMIKGLAIAIVELNKVLNCHLLSPRKINYDCDSIFFNTALQSYQFIYTPHNLLCRETDVLFLFRHLFLECSDLFDSKVFHLLNSKSFNLEHFCQMTFESKKFWEKLKISRIKQNEKSNTQTNTKPLETCLIDKKNPTISHPICFEMTTIGRGDNNNIQLEDLTISQSHALIHLNARECTIEDLNSKNGTFINNTLIRSKTSLKTGDHIKIGEKEFVFIR